MLSRDEILPDSQAAIMTARDEFKQRRRESGRAVCHGLHPRRPAVQPGRRRSRQARGLLKLIVKSIFPRDEELLKAVAPHWEWIAEDGMPNVASVMQQQDFWADTFKMVEHKVPQDRVIDVSIAKEAAQRLDAEKPFG